MKDLSTIPEEFHSIFTTDWNKGDSSEMCNADRQIIHQIFHEYNRWSINKALLKNMPSTEVVEMPLVGFIKD
jgi:hypothetical protein